MLSNHLETKLSANPRRLLSIRYENKNEIIYKYFSTYNDKNIHTIVTDGIFQLKF